MIICLLKSASKCFSKENTGNEFNSNNVQLLCLKKIDETQNIDEIKLSIADKIIVESYLDGIISPFTKIEVISPQFEDLWIKCKVNFIDISAGLGIQKLQNDLFEFICSWLYNNSSFDRFGNPIKVLEIINFLKQRSYVNFISGITS